MSRTVRLTLAATAAALMAFGAHAAGDAAGAQAKNGTQAISTGHKLLKTYFDTDSPSTGLVAGANDIGTVLTVNCGNAAGCTIAGSMNAQLAAIATENTGAVCLVVDGTSVSCPWNAIIRGGSGYQVMNYSTFTSVTPGNHTVQMRIYVGTATTLHRWNKEFRLYKP